MGIFDKIFGSKKYGGRIEALGLTDFWEGLTEEEREKIRKYAKRGLGGFDKEIDDPEHEVQTSHTAASNFLNSMSNYSLPDKEYELTEKLLKESLERNENNPVDLHFAYNNLIKLYYKQRDKNDYLEKCIEICKKDIALYKNKLKDESFFQENDTRIPAFQRLAIIYEKQEKYEKAIEVCEKAIKYDMRDTTKNGFEGRLEKLKKKI